MVKLKISNVERDQSSVDFTTALTAALTKSVTNKNIFRTMLPKMYFCFCVSHFLSIRLIRITYMNEVFRTVLILRVFRFLYRKICVSMKLYDRQRMAVCRAQILKSYLVLELDS